MSKLNKESSLEALIETLSWSRKRGYRGHSKHDALNSPLLSALSCNNRFLRLMLIQSVMRAPFNIRSVLCVPRLRNPKGIGLFAHTWLDLAAFLKQNPRESFPFTASGCIAEAEKLLEWLIHNASPQAPPSPGCMEAFNISSNSHGKKRHLAGLGWGYHYPWQDVGFFQPRNYPNRVVSSWIGFAFLRAAEVTEKERYLKAAHEISSFLLDNPRRLVESDNMLCLSYVPDPNINWAVMDVSALVSSFCARLASTADEPANLLSTSKRLMSFVVDKQTSYGAWFYTWPAGDSRIKHDNYHTGIILDCLADYMTFSNDHAYAENYRAGLEYYRNQLFFPDGAPRWMNNKTHPHDTHGAASGIMAFTRAAEYWKISPERDHAFSRENAAFSHNIMQWTLNNLYSNKGFFYYQKTRMFTKKFCLMRWCNAWMCRAIAKRLLSQENVDLPE